MKKMVLTLLCLFVVAITFLNCGCRTRMLEDWERPFDIGVTNDAVAGAVVLQGALRAEWMIDEINTNGVVVSYKKDRFSVRCLVSAHSSMCSIMVLDAIGLDFHSQDRRIHKLGLSWIAKLKRSICEIAHGDLTPYEFRKRAISVAVGVDLKEVILAVCRGYDLSVRQDDSGRILASAGEGPERCQLVIEYSKMMLSVVHRRPVGAETNGFQYDLLVRSIVQDIVRLADPHLAELRRQTDTLHADQLRLEQALRKMRMSVNQTVIIHN